jgi:hypothetical protein
MDWFKGNFTGQPLFFFFFSMGKSMVSGEDFPNKTNLLIGCRFKKKNERLFFGPSP